MKKLMIAAAAAFCGTVSFAELASANTVGYNTLNKGDGAKYMMAGNVFQNMDATEVVKIKDLKGAFNDQDELQVVFMTGEGIKFDFKIYKYYVDDAWLYDSDEPVWVDNDTDAVVTDSDVINLAKAVYFITSSGDGADFQTSGQIKKIAHTHTFDSMYSMMSSAFPVEFNPNSSTLDWSVPNMTEIQTVFMTGEGIKFDFNIYKYYVDDAWLYDSDDPIWVDNNTDAPVESAIAGIGEGFYLIIPSDNDPAESGVVESSPIN